MKDINKYIIERGAAPTINLSKTPIYFSKQEIEKIKKDINDKNGQFYKFVKDKVDSLTVTDINDYLDQCLDDIRCTAEMAYYISEIIGRQNFGIKEVQKFINDEL